MKIIEQFIQSKTPNAEDCEDGIFVNDNFVAVIDGATSYSSTRWDDKRPGKMATELILAGLAGLDPDADARQAMRELNRAIADWYATKGVYDEMRDNTVERCVAHIVVFSKSKSQIWFLGDCQALVDGTLITNSKLVDTVTSSARAMFIESALLGGKSVTDFQEHDSGRDFIFPLLEKQTRFQNAKGNSGFEFAVLDGFFENEDAIKIVDVAPETDAVVLASDGYPTLASTLAESERVLAEVLHEDPLMFRRYKSAKGLQKGNVSYDDRAYIKFYL